MVQYVNYKIATVRLEGPELGTVRFTLNEIERLRADPGHDGSFIIIIL